MRRHVICSVFREIALGNGNCAGSLSNEVLERHLSGKVENTNQRLNLRCHCNQTVNVSLPACLRKWTLQCHFSRGRRMEVCEDMRGSSNTRGHNSGLCHREDWLFYLPHRVKRTGRKAYKLKCIMSLMLKHKREILLEKSKVAAAITLPGHWGLTINFLFSET